ncbi:MAG TPA: HAMP domain-containing histidine kinase [Candidatus Onthousia excrementipullorum]|uniref:histidine kinase n=1 Tax=Candidatus Onthousia excrementipullorum TaxID=2840884 RepID=A0A9D1DTD5_9FIRM|nr:HAMP domain-containing histidine kinase [Candidatus Onthousia excrementipullorum]
MSYIEVIIESIILLLCPLALYLLYTIYKKNLSCDEKDLGFEIAIISSLYFVLRYGTCCYNDYPIILFDIPLLICYYKRKMSLAFFISLILIIYETLFLGINPLFLALEYSSYLIVYSLFTKKKLKPINVVNYFIIIKSFMLSLEVFWFISPERSYSSNLFYIFTIIITLYFVTNIIISIFAKGEKIVELHNDLQNIEKEKDLRRSLFKVTHEIKNPIAVCKGYLDMIDINDKKKVRKYIPIIKDEITRTLVLMDDFLDYTKIKIEKEDMDLIMLLEDLEDYLEDLFKKNGIKAEFNIPDEDIYIEADYNRLKQVFINLLKNAIEAKDSSKKENIIKISLESDNEFMKIIIEDNGVGMDKDTLNNVSEMFFTTKRRGSGLGVSLSKEIIEQHNGTIVYNSVKGEGTRVIVTLPKEINMA